MSLGNDLLALARHQFRLIADSRRPDPRPPTAGVCAFCGELGTVLVIDYDHETGRNRGMVHPACNAAIGSHTKRNVHRLVEYLNRDADLGSYPVLSQQS